MVMAMTKTHTKTKTKCIKDLYDIFSNSREFKDIKYDTNSDHQIHQDHQIH